MVLVAAGFTVSVLALGYVLLGWLPTFLFAFGFLGGLVAWLLLPSRGSFDAIRLPYYGALAGFVVHKLEERYLGFFPALSSITDVPVPEDGSFLAVLLYAFAGAWLLIPFLVRRGYAFGHYLAFTFFVSMGVTELAHFVLPLLRPQPYGYFPGMASVVVLAPIAWVGIWRLVRSDPAVDTRTEMEKT